MLKTSFFYVCLEVDLKIIVLHEKFLTSHYKKVNDYV